MEAPKYYLPTDLETTMLYQSRHMAALEVPPAGTGDWSPAELRQMQTKLQRFREVVRVLPEGCLEEYR